MKAQNKKDQSTDVKKEIEQALISNSVQFEEVTQDDGSPLNQPVVEKDLKMPGASATAPSGEGLNEPETNEDQDLYSSDGHEDNKQQDAPEQEVGETFDGSSQEDDQEMPLSHAQIAADTFLGMTDNLLEVGGGFFVKIRKHEEFYEFEEVVQVIDEQNEKNIRRLKLDDEDRALLRPLLVIIIRKRVKKLTPEQQLAGAVISILIKKAKTAVEMRAENNLLVERIRDIIKQETSNSADSVAPTEESKSHHTPVQNPELATVLEVAD